MEFFSSSKSCRITPTSPYRQSSAISLPSPQSAARGMWMGTGLKRPSLAQTPATPAYLQHRAALCKPHNTLTSPFISDIWENNQKSLSGCCLKPSTGYTANIEKHCVLCGFFSTLYTRWCTVKQPLWCYLIHVGWLWIMHAFAEGETLQGDVKSIPKQKQIHSVKGAADWARTHLLLFRCL